MEEGAVAEVWKVSRGNLPQQVQGSQVGPHLEGKRKLCKNFILGLSIMHSSCVLVLHFLHMVMSLLCVLHIQLLDIRAVTMAAGPALAEGGEIIVVRATKLGSVCNLAEDALVE